MPGKIGQIICTGNVCDKETYEYLRTVAPEVHVVRGEFDEVCTSYPHTGNNDFTVKRISSREHTKSAVLRAQGSHYPISIVIPHQSLRIGVVHGQQLIPVGDIDVLSTYARQMDVDVLVSGSTHRYVFPVFVCSDPYVYVELTRQVRGGGVRWEVFRQSWFGDGGLVRVVEWVSF